MAGDERGDKLVKAVETVRRGGGVGGADVGTARGGGCTVQGRTTKGPVWGMGWGGGRGRGKGEERRRCNRAERYANRHEVGEGKGERWGRGSLGWAMVRRGWLGKDGRKEGCLVF